MKKQSVRGLLALVFCLAAMLFTSVTVQAALFRKTTVVLNMRSSANSTDYNTIVATIPKGATVELIGRSKNYPNWYYVGYNGKKGFVLGSYLTSTTDSSSSSSSESESSSNVQEIAVNVNFRTSAKIDANNIIRVLKKGEKVTVVGETSTNWIKVKASDGRQGYVAAGYFTSTYSKNAVYQTTAVALNLRKTPKVASNNLIRVIPANKEVQILGTSGNWFRVKYSSSTGYVKSGYFKSDTKTNSVTETVNANLRLRSSAKIANGNIILTIPRGRNVTVLKEVNGGWYYVQYGSYKGYVKAGYFRSDGSSSSSSPSTSSSSSSTKKTTANLRLRSSTSTSSSSNIITVIPKGAQVTVLSHSSGWCRVTYGGATGYVSEDYLS